eukprot:scaffold7514_cov112-Skeletonema_dohrnii-CCMP3373.AAC.6
MTVNNNIAIVWSIIVPLGLLPLGCFSFHIIQPTSKFDASKSLSCLYSTKSSADTEYVSPFNLEEFNDDSSLQPNNDNNAVEIWLDLRETTLSPSTALELWDLECTDANYNNDDDGGGLTKSGAPFTKCLVSPSDKSNSNGEKQMQLQNNIQVLVDYGTNNQNEQTTESTSPWGKVLPLQTNTQSMPILPDPLPAMETISQGQYIVLDTTKGWKKVEEEQRLSYLLPLAELISSGATTGGENGSSGSGGIGFTCLTKNEVVKVAMWIQSITNNNRSGDGGGGQNVRVKTLENGLVIPDYDNDDDVMSDLQKQFGSSRQARLQYAIVVPYDVGLLKTASMLLLNEGF